MQHCYLLNYSRVLKESYVINSIDEFHLTFPDSLGDIQRIRIGHDDHGLGSAWYLDKVIVEDESVGKRFVFIGQRWLDRNQNDHQTECDLIEGDMVTHAVDDHEQAETFLTEAAEALEEKNSSRSSSRNDQHTIRPDSPKANVSVLPKAVPTPEKGISYCDR